jgi:hypothetical protein
MLPRLLSLSSPVFLALIVLMIVPANATPSLSLGSNASYNFSLNFGEAQSCNASPLSYNQTACGPPVPPQQWSFRDDFNYTSISQLQAAGWGIESIAPLSYYRIDNSTLTLLNDGTVGAGAGHSVPGNNSNWSVSARVDWIGSSGNVSGYVGSLQVAVGTVGHSYDWMADGYYNRFGLGMDGHDLTVFPGYVKQLNIWHVLRLDMIDGTLYGYFDGSLIGSYAVPNTTPSSSDLVNIQALASWETNNGFDWMEANSLPSPAAVSMPVTAPSVGLTGILGWTLVGLDANTAVLNLTHSLSVKVGNIPIAPVAETGSFQQSINLSTRAEARGTSLELISNIMPLLATSLASPSSTGTSLPVPPSSLLSSNMPTIYTIWWINGPLSTGSPVQLLTGYSSVQGTEAVNLPGTLGARNAWIVSSTLDESLTTLLPQLSVLNPTGSLGPLNSNNADVRLALRFDYDQSSDLLLSSSDTATVTSTSTNLYPPGQLLCGLSGQCTTVSTLTTVRNVMTLSLTASLTLSTTNLNLGKRMGANGQPPGVSMLSTLQALMWQPIVYALAGIAAAAIASVVVWITKRQNRTKTSVIQAPFQPILPQ